MITEEDCFNKFEGLRELVAEVERIVGPSEFEPPNSNSLGLGGCGMAHCLGSTIRRQVSNSQGWTTA